MSEFEVQGHPIPRKDIEDALSSLLESAEFQSAPLRAQFLDYVVKEALEGRADRLKGTAIAFEIYGRGADFDQQADPIVRVEARRIRRDLEHYYLTAGATDEVIIDIPKGGYAPAFRRRTTGALNCNGTGHGTSPSSPERESAPSPSRADAAQPRRRPLTRSVQFGAVLALGFLLGAGGVALISGRLGGPSVPGAVVTVPGPATTQSTLFITPFESFVPDAASDALARGLTEEIAAVVSSFKEIAVFPVPATFVETLNTTEDDRQEKAASYLLLGNVRIVEDRVRIRAALRDANSGQQIWSELYEADYSPTRIFEIQDRISLSVSRKLAEPYGVLADTVRGELRERYEPGLAPYKCVLAGYEYRQTYTQEKHLEVRDCLESATSQEPEYARAWAVLAHVIIDEDRVFYNTRPNAITRAMDAAQTAVRLDPTDPYSFQALSVAQFISGSIDDALASARTAVDLNPHNKEALWQLGYRHWLSGDYAKGTEIVQRAMDESPVYPPWYHWVLAAENYRIGNYDGALLHAESMGTPGLAFAEALRAMIYAQLGRTEEARSALERCRHLDPLFDSRARELYSVNQIQNDVLDLFMEGLRKAGLDS